jgi:transposase
MDGKIEKQVCINFCVKLGKSATEILEMLRVAFGKYSLTRTAVSEWQSRFKAGRMSVEDNERSGRPSTSKTTENVERIRELIYEDRRRQIHELADTVGISYGVYQEILTENLNMRYIAPPSRQRTSPHIPENYRVCD